MTTRYITHSFSRFLIVIFSGLFFSNAAAMISHRVVDSEFKGGIIIFEVEVYEDILKQSLPNASELSEIAERLIGDRRNDDRRKLVQFYLEVMQEDSGVYALATIEGSSELEININPLSIYEDPKYGRYLNDDLEIIDSLR